MKALVADFSLGREFFDRLKSKFGRGGNRNASGGLSINLVDVPEPRLISQEWVRIRTIMSAISDMEESMIFGHEPPPYASFLTFPFVPGNENLGIVTDTGEGVEDIELGERVVVDPILACRARGVEPSCVSCSRGEPSGCRNFAGGVPGPGIMIGACRDTSGGWGDYFVAHRSQVRIVPQAMESSEAVLIPEFSRALRAVLQHPPAAGDSVLVVGAGSLGLLTLCALRVLGHEVDVILVAEHPFDPNLARTFGASEVIAGFGPGATYEEVAGLVGASVYYPEAGRITMRGGADLVYETTGRGGQIEDAINFTGEGRRLVLMGMGYPQMIDASLLRFKGVRLETSLFSGVEYMDGGSVLTFDLAMDLVGRYGLPSEELVTHTFRLEEHAQAFDALWDKAHSRAVKVIFHHAV